MRVRLFSRQEPPEIGEMLLKVETLKLVPAKKRTFSFPAHSTRKEVEVLAQSQPTPVTFPGQHLCVQFDLEGPEAGEALASPGRRPGKR